MATSKPRPRRWLRYSIRSLLLLVLALSIWLGWMANRAARQRHAAQALEQIGAKIFYEHSWPNQFDKRVPAWVLNTIGEDWFYDVVGVSFSFPSFTDAELQAAMPHLHELSNLNVLFLDGTKLTDESMPRITECKTLTTLNLDSTRITNEGLLKLKSLPHLQRLSIAVMPNLTDEGLLHFHEFPALTDVTFSNRKGNTAVTQKGWDAVNEFLRHHKN